MTDGDINQCPFHSNIRTIAQHCDVLVELLNEIVDNLDNSGQMKNMLQDYGEKHGSLCVR
jgi:hypothetical protein